MQIAAYILSCPERERTLKQTIANLQNTDWAGPVEIEIDQTNYERRQERQERTASRLLRRAVADGHEFILFLEDDLRFNRHLSHNLERWRPLIQTPEGDHFFGSLYNPTIRELARDDNHAFFLADPECVYGSQAFILSLRTTRHIVTHWDDVEGMQDIKMSRLAARVCPIYYHAPSLVQHIGLISVWGGHYHWANDFQAEWRA